MTWRLPPWDFPVSERPFDDDKILDAGIALVEKFASLGVECEVQDISVGPSTTIYELRAGPKTTMREFRRLDRAQDLAYELGAASVRIQTPIPGRRVVGVEVGSQNRRPVVLGDVLQAASAPLTAALGLTDAGPLGLALNECPHTLLAGRSGAGKSNLLHGILASLLVCSTPDDLRLILVDTKMTELVKWAGIPHLLGEPLTNVNRALDGFDWLCMAMEERYEEIASMGCSDIAEYNATRSLLKLSTMPYYLLVCDELADAMMMAAGELESYVVRLGQKGRAAGVHLLLATQSPRAQVCSGLIKANMGAKIALRTGTALDSRVILDQNGAESLLGKGDGLFDDGSSGQLQRFQAPLIAPETIREITGWWKAQVREEVAAA